MIVALAIASGGCGDAGDAQAPTPPAPAQLDLTVSRPSDGHTTTVSRITVAGRVTEGATVTVNGDEADVIGRRYEHRVALDLGANTVGVSAQLRDATADESLTIHRESKPPPPPPPPPPPAPPAPLPPAPPPPPDCHPSYEGACLDPTSSDYDCEGGSGNGPDYTGPVSVVGPDEFDLDRDGDGSACE